MNDSFLIIFTKNKITIILFRILEEYFQFVLLVTESILGFISFNLQLLKYKFKFYYFLFLFLSILKENSLLFPFLCNSALFVLFTFISIYSFLREFHVNNHSFHCIG